MQVTETVTNRRLRPAFGTFVSVYCVAPHDAVAERAVTSAFESIARVQRLMHPTSGADLVAIRTAPLHQAVRVDRWTWDVLVLAAEVNEISEGRFDPCLPEEDGRTTDIDLPEPGVVVVRQRVALDLGGIAKGFAVDRAIDCLRSIGCNAGEVNAGGDVAVFGPTDTPLWVRTRGGTRPVLLRNRACAVSDAMSYNRPIEHRGYYNRVRSEREPVPAGTLPAVVIASTAAVADALTKCVLLCTRETPLLERALAHFDATSIEFADAFAG